MGSRHEDFIILPIGTCFQFYHVDMSYSSKSSFSCGQKSFRKVNSLILKKKIKLSSSIELVHLVTICEDSISLLF